MAIVKSTDDLNIIAKLPDEPNDVGGLTSPQLKAKFDEAVLNLQAYINGLVDILNSVTPGSSGSENISSAPIDGLTGNNVYQQISDLLNVMQTADANLLTIAQQAQAGNIIDGAITDAKLSNEEGQIKDIVNKHVIEKATNLTLGHIKQGTGISIDTNGIASVALGSAFFSKGSSTFTDNDTSQTFTDANCTANSLVIVSITSSTVPQGTWKVTSAAGSFTITSSAAESADITFDYYIVKAVV